MEDSSEGRFAFLYDLFFDSILQRVRKHIFKILQNSGSKKIIDMGCGTGSQLQFFSKEGLELTGIDSSSSMLQVAQRKKIPQATFLNKDILHNDFSDGYFDCAIITLVLHANNKKTLSAILKEAERITRNGQIIITDYDNGQGFKGYLASFLIRIIESLAKTTHRRGYFEFMRRGGLEKILLKEGYTPTVAATFYGKSLKTCIVQCK